ncbi:2TM domain-containing protein [Patescibacteria group bacterium]
MEVDQKDSQRYQRAKKRVKEMREYYTHLIVYAGVNVMLFVINWLTAPGTWWFYWVTIFWGIGIGWHTIAFFFTDRMEGSNWEERKIKEQMEKDKQSEDK